MRHHDRYAVVKRTTLVNSSINTLLALFKIVLGSVGHSHALVADGVHSFSDLITDAIMLFASKMGTEEPDREHPYGHRRIETIATISIAFLLAAVAVGIGYDTLSHIILGTVTKKPDFFVVMVAIVSIVANESLYHYTLFSGNKINSDLLRSNAWHNRSDALISIIVLVSVLGSLFGAKYLDTIGALIIALLILKIAIKMISKSIQELIDASADQALIQRISQAIIATPGVNALHQLRTRSHGENIFLDVHIEVNGTISVSEAHYISEQVNLNLIKEFDPVTDVVVHIDPENDERFMLSKDLPNRAVVEKTLFDHWQHLPYYPNIKRLQLHYLNGKINLEVYLSLALLIKNTNFSTKIGDDLKAAVSTLKYIETISVFYE